jgi:hypothetical protein
VRASRGGRNGTGGGGATLKARWVLVDYYIATGDETVVTWSSSGTGSQQHAVNGDTDKGYMFEFLTKGDDVSGCSGTIRLNGATTDQTYSHRAGVSALSEGNAGMGDCGGTSSVDAMVAGVWIMDSAVTGETRQCRSERVMTAPVNGTALMVTTVAEYDDSSTNITIIDFTCTVGNFVSGSEFRLYVLGTQF